MGSAPILAGAKASPLKSMETKFSINAPMLMLSVLGICGSIAAKYLASIDFNGDTPAPAKMGTGPIEYGTAALPQTFNGNGP